MTVTRFVTACALSSAALTAQLTGAAAFTAQSMDPVVQWNRNLLAIVRTPGAQPATRSSNVLRNRLASNSQTTPSSSYLSSLSTNKPKSSLSER